MNLGPLSELLVIGTLAIQASSAADWKQGKLVDLSMSMTPLRNGRPAPRKSILIPWIGGDKVYEAQEVARMAPHVEVNSPIDYSVSKDYVLVRDSDRKVHKLALVKTTRKQ
jgi:hypothetical protein